MDRIFRGFMAAAVVYGVAGILIGLHMAIAADHEQLATHAHVNLIGWVSFFLFALFYRFFGAGVPKPLALAHFWLAQISTPAIFVGIWMMHAGDARFEPLAAVASLVYGVSFLLFAVGALKSLAGRGHATTVSDQLAGT